MRVAARLATSADLRAVVHAADLARHEKLQQRGGPIWSVVEAPGSSNASYVQRLLDDGESLLAVGTIDDVVTGFASATLLHPNDEGPAIADLRALFVEPEARGVGVGEALMSVVAEWAAVNRCRGIDSIALPGDRATKNFFESFGLVARAIKVHKAL